MAPARADWAQPIFRAAAEHVSINVVVTDHDNQPVLDLGANDFQILEGGRLQTVSDFRTVSVPLSRRAFDADTSRSIAADVVTNDAARSPDSRKFVIVVDDLHLLESTIVPVKRVLTRFVEDLSSDDEAAIVFVGRSDLSEDFTSDRRRLLEGIDRTRAAVGFGIEPPSSTPFGDPPLTEASRAARAANYVVRNVAAALAGCPHRCAILYVGGGSPLDLGAPIGEPERLESDTLLAELRDTFREAKQAGVPIYSVDPRGALVPDDAVRGSITTEAARTEITRRIHIQQDFLAALALNTGGRALINQSNLDRAVDQVVIENGSFYVLGYYPKPWVNDGKFHDVTVRVTRPGVRARAQAGYWATPAAKAPAKSPADVLKTAMTSALTVSDMPLRAFATPVGRNREASKLAVVIEVAYPVGNADGRSVAINDELQTSVLAVDPDGRVKGSSRLTFPVKATSKSGEPAAFLIDDIIEVPQERLTLRIGVVSRKLSRVGTVRLPVNTASRDGGNLTVAGIVLGEADRNEPAVNSQALAGLVPFQPTTTRTFPASATVRVFARARWQNKQPTAEVVLQVEGAPRGPSLTLEPMAVTGRPTLDGHYEAAIDTTVTLKTLSGGPYVLTVEVRLPSGETARSQVPIQIN